MTIKMSYWAFFLSSAVLISALSIFFILTPGNTNAQENAPPTISSHFISASANAKTDTYAGGAINDLVLGGVRVIHINGVVEDLDGRDDIVSVESVFHRSSVEGADACTADNNDCYRESSCTLTDNEDVNQKEYDCLHSLEYWIDATDTGGRFEAQNWMSYIKVSDAVSSNSDNTVNKEMNTILGLTIGEIVYGTLALEQMTDAATNVDQLLTQQGNDLTDVEVSSVAAMSCDVRGTIPVANQQWSLSDIAWDETGTNELTGVAADTDVAVGYRDDDATELTSNLHWNISVPTGLEGQCLGTIAITAISG